MADIATVWARIEQHEGEVFYRGRRGAFAYKVIGNSQRLSRTNQVIPRAHVAEALALVPLQSIVPVQYLVAPPTSMPA